MAIDHEHGIATPEEDLENTSEHVRTGADMSAQWLTVSEVVAYCTSQGLPRTPKTVRRWAARAIQFPGSEAEVKVQRQDTENGFRWLIDRNSLDIKIQQERDFELRSRMASTDENMSTPVPTGPDMSAHVLVVESTMPETRSDENISEPVRTRAHGTDDQMLEFLKQQIEIKDQQIAVKDRQIESMLERNRETNILIQGLQTNLVRVAEALPGARRGNPQEGDNSPEAPTSDAVQ